MAERSFFFNSAPGDPRTYQASDFAQYFGNVLSSGLIHTDNIPALEVKCEGNDLRTYVTPGKAIIQGYAYENTENLYLEHALPEPTLDRIDRIVLRLDKRHQSRYIRLFVKQGTPSDNPVPPDLQRDDFIYELSLAQIRVRANTSTLNPADLIDERLNEDLCGLVHSLISIPTSQFEQEWREFMDGIKDEGFATRDELNALQQEVDEHKADTTAHGIGDKSTLLTTNKNTIVEAINELFTFANNGKTDWATVIGAPLSPSDTFAQLRAKTQTLKNTFATNLTNKGQTASGTEPLQSLINKVANISTGKKWAGGSVILNFVNGVTKTHSQSLAFTPTLVIVFLNDNNFVAKITNFAPNVSSFNANGRAGVYIVQNLNLTSNGFQFEYMSFSQSGDVNTFWVAVE